MAVVAVVVAMEAMAAVGGVAAAARLPAHELHVGAQPRGALVRLGSQDVAAGGRQPMVRVLAAARPRRLPLDVLRLPRRARLRVGRRPRRDEGEVATLGVVRVGEQPPQPSLEEAPPLARVAVLGEGGVHLGEGGGQERHRAVFGSGPPFGALSERTRPGVPTVSAALSTQACTERHSRGCDACCTHTMCPLQKRLAGSGATRSPRLPLITRPSAECATTGNMLRSISRLKTPCVAGAARECAPR